MVLPVAGSLNEPNVSHFPVAGSSRRIWARSEFFTHTLPSTSDDTGVTNACWVASVCHSFGTDQVSNFSVLGSKRATPAWYIIEIQSLPLFSVSRSSVPIGKPSLITGNGYSDTLRVLGSSLPRNCSPKCVNQT